MSECWVCERLGSRRLRREIEALKAEVFAVRDANTEMGKRMRDAEANIAAAEERGRRAGIEEAADKAYTAAHEAAEEIWKLHGGVQEAPCYQAAIAALRTIRKLDVALAPRDSGPAHEVGVLTDDNATRITAPKARK